MENVPAVTPMLRTKDLRAAIAFDTDVLDALRERVRERARAFDGGMRESAIPDADGDRLRIGQDLRRAAAAEA